MYIYVMWVSVCVCSSLSKRIRFVFALINSNECVHFASVQTKLSKCIYRKGGEQTEETAERKRVNEKETSQQKRFSVFWLVLPFSPVATENAKNRSDASSLSFRKFGSQKYAKLFDSQITLSYPTLMVLVKNEQIFLSPFSLLRSPLCVTQAYTCSLKLN